MCGALDVATADEAACSTWVARTFARMVEEAPQGYLARLDADAASQALRARLQGMCCNIAWGVLRSLKRSDFRPWGAELGMGKGEKLPSLAVELPHGGKAYLTGRIDRVDGALLEDGEAALRVVDYKSGLSTVKIDEIYYGLHLQLAAYLLALEDVPAAVGQTRATPGGMLYFKLGDIPFNEPRPYRMGGLILKDAAVIRAMDTARGEKETSPVAPLSAREGQNLLGREAMDALLAYTRKKLGALAEGIARGVSDICPSKRKGQDGCAHCAYRPLCGYDVRMRPLRMQFMPDLKQQEALEKMQQEVRG